MFVFHRFVQYVLLFLELKYEYFFSHWYPQISNSKYLLSVFFCYYYSSVSVGYSNFRMATCKFELDFHWLTHYRSMLSSNNLLYKKSKVIIYSIKSYNFWLKLKKLQKLSFQHILVCQWGGQSSLKLDFTLIDIYFSLFSEISR